MDLLWQGRFYALTPASFGKQRRSTSPLSALPASTASSGCFWAPDGCCGRQIARCSKSKFPNAPSCTGVILLTLLGRALVAAQVLESTCNRSCLHHTMKEAIKQAQLYRALSVLSGRGFNFIQTYPPALGFLITNLWFLFFICTLLDFAVSE